MTLPHPSPFSPQSKPWAAHVRGVHVIATSAVPASDGALASPARSSTSRPVRLPHAATASSEAATTAKSLRPARLTRGL
jgi:hypothetical protein